MGYLQATARATIANGCMYRGSVSVRSIRPVYGDLHVTGETPMPTIPAVQRIPEWQSIEKATVVLGPGATITVDTHSLDNSIANLDAVRGNLGNNINDMSLDLTRFEGDLDTMEQLIGP